MKILDGKKLSEKILDNLKKEIKAKGLKLKLAVILNDRDPVSDSFVRQQQRACQKVGIDFELFELSSSKKEIKKIIKDPNNSGVVIVNNGVVPPEKNVEKPSPVVCAISRILKEYKISLKNKNIVLIGRGRLVGIPVAKWLHEQSLEFSDNIKEADIIISGVGKPNLITGEMVKKGVVVIDVGRDVDFKTVSKKAKYITPVSGGVGPVVVACLLQNLVNR